MVMRSQVSTIIFLTTLVFALPVSAQKPTAAHGKQLFSDPALGGSKNPTSCNSCHQSGKGLVDAGERADLADAVNYCIVNPMQGEPLQVESVQMQSLMLYIRSLKQ